jgi:hypothetical protein
VANVGFVVAAHARVARDHGTRAYHYSSIPTETRRVTAALCAAARERHLDRLDVDLGEVPGVLPPPFLWYARHLPACAGITLTFEGGGGARIRYDASTPTDARLVVALP